MKVQILKYPLNTAMVSLFGLSNKGSIVHEASANLFFGRQLKAHLPIFWHHKCLNTCINNEGADPEIPSKYSKDQSVWIKLDPNTKWVPGKITQVLPNQSYEVTLIDGRIFRRNEHHITLRWQGTKWPQLYLNCLIYLIHLTHTWGQGERPQETPMT